MRVTLYLLRTGWKADSTALSANGYDEVELGEPPAGVSWALFVRSQPAQPPRWVQTLAAHVPNNGLARLANTNSSAVLLAEHADRTYALTFGSGFSALDSSAIERDFGLRVAANLVPIDGVIGADTKELSRSGPSRKVLLPDVRHWQELGVEPTEELLRQLSGKTLDQTFATRVAGSDSLRINIENFDLKRLPETLTRLRTAYEATTYRDAFGFLDDLTRVTPADPVFRQLHSKATALLLAQSPDLSFAAPDPFEQLEAERYLIRWYRKSEVVDLLGTAEVYPVLSALRLGKDPLNQVKVTPFNSEGDQVDREHPLLDYLQAEINLDGHKYVLLSGEWFRVAADYVQSVDEYIAAIPELGDALPLPDWSKGGMVDDDASEGAYNVAACSDSGLALLDRRNLALHGRQRIEVCDILTAARQLICVKRASKSSTLSHLFAQGQVSATLFHDERYSTFLLQELRKLDPTIDLVGPPADWTFVFAIATERPEALATSLFFFSKVALQAATRDIRARGFKVAVRRIPIT